MKWPENTMTALSVLVVVFDLFLTHDSIKSVKERVQTFKKYSPNNCTKNSTTVFSWALQ